MALDRTIHDIVVIGGGPAGLICALTGITGIPINPPRHFSGLVLDRFEIGQFCKYGKLRITHKWFFMGNRLIEFLHAEAKASGLDLRENEPVTGIDFGGDVKLIATDSGTFRARKVAICTGFFPHGHLAKHTRNVRVVFSPAELEGRELPAQKGQTVGVLGGGPATLEFAAALKKLRPELRFLVALEEGAPAEGEEDYDGLELHRGSLQVVAEGSKNVKVRLLNRDGSDGGGVKLRFLLVDYNSYTLQTRVTGFLAGSGIETRQGYISVDRNGRTGVPGVFAAGNIVTPISGVLTAMTTGFAAGLGIYEELFEDKFGNKPPVYPWLPRSGGASHPLNSEQPEPRPEHPETEDLGPELEN